MQTTQFFGITIPGYLYVPVAYLVWVMLGLFIKWLVLRGIRRVAHQRVKHLDRVLIQALDIPLVLVIFSSGWVVLGRTTPFLRDGEIVRFLMLGFQAVTIIAAVLFVDRLITGVLSVYAHRWEILKTSAGVVRSLTHLLVMGIGALILIDSFGISITPIIASLGIGSLAIALALQPTLENFFAGIQLVTDKPIQVGQFVKLESGEEGYVYKIGWRSTWIRMLPNHMVVIPNNKLVNSRVTNYCYPDTEVGVLVQVGVHYQSDLEQVERVTIEVAKEVMTHVAAGVSTFDPFIRYHTLGDFSIQFTVILRAKEFVDHFVVKHEFIKRLQKRYAQEGIVIPYPIRATNVTQEQAFSQNKA